jgi:hypothetical protein
MADYLHPNDPGYVVFACGFIEPSALFSQLEQASCAAGYHPRG